LLALPTYDEALRDAIAQAEAHELEQAQDHAQRPAES
jgi:hypothetical protein